MEQVIEKDTSSDIAVLQITDNFSPENIVPLTIANSSSLQVGQVIAIANPFGLGDTMTTGIVSRIMLEKPDVLIPKEQTQDFKRGGMSRNGRRMQISMYSHIQLIVR
ncbi:MAG: trypsin-like peptidase domain-containing protein [Candidatus Nitrosopolaris sp.]